MSIMRSKAALILFFVCGMCYAQKKIVPIPLEHNWPLSSSILDSVEYFTAKNIAENKVRICEEYDGKGIRRKMILFSRDGYITNEFSFNNNGISYETFFIRNYQGQIIQETNISYNKELEFRNNKYEYSNNKPFKAFLSWGSHKEAIYRNDTLSEVIDENNFSERVYRVKELSGTYTFIGKDDKASLFENANRDSVVSGNFSRTFYKIKNRRIKEEEYHGVDYWWHHVYHYDSIGLLILTEKEYGEGFSKHKRKTFYKYYYYED